MMIGGTAFLLLILPALLSAESEHLQYSYLDREIYDLNYDTLSHRAKRQSQSSDQDLYVTQCSHDNIDPTVLGPNINVSGRQLQYPEATEKAAKLIYLMVRFMPRSMFVRLANHSSVGLFPYTQLPSLLFDEFSTMPSICATNCRKDVLLPTGETVDCSVWCSSPEYPYNANYPMGYLWAYGNFSRTFIVETNVLCTGFNPGVQASFSENLLIREFGLTVMTRGLDTVTYGQLEEAYAASVQSNTWPGVRNVYHYFMLGTQAWFNGVQGNNLYPDETAPTGAVSSGSSLFTDGMVCLGTQSPAEATTCNDGYDQRQRLKTLDPQLYAILNFVYNNKRQFLDGDLSTCEW